MKGRFSLLSFRRAPVVLAATLTGVLAGVAAAQPYPVTGVGSLNGGPSIAWGIANFGVTSVVCESDFTNSANHRACTWVQSGLGATNLGTDTSGTLTPWAGYRIGPQLIYVGVGFKQNALHAFRCNAGVTIDLGTINPLLVNGEARGINAAGTIVGTNYAANSYPGAIGNQSFAFKWVQTGANAGTLGMIPLHAAYDINDSDLVVGQLNGLPYRLNLGNSQLTSMGTLGGSVGSGAAMSINNNGAAVGWSPAPNNFRHAFVWTQGGGMVDIHPSSLSGSLLGESFAYDINASGMVVGQFYGGNSGPNGHAFLYYNGLYRDLNTWLPANSGWVLEAAYGINDAHCIVGRGKRNGQTEGFVMCVQPPTFIAPPCNTLNPIPNARMCRTGSTSFEVSTVGVAPFTYQWQWQPNDTSDWVDVVDGINMNAATGEPAFVGALSGSQVTMSGVAGLPTPPPGGDTDYLVRAYVFNPCDIQLSNAAFLTISCPNKADVSHLGGTPGCDGQTTADDIVFYLSRFFANDAGVADLVGPGGDGGPDGQVTVDDLVAFLSAFFTFCH
ncbi:MAG: GC-type dockerin domain-anchored protein [Phycisphaerales bacterium]